MIIYVTLYNGSLIHLIWLTFDPMAAAETTAGMTVGVILHPERAARLAEYHSRDPGLPGLGDVINRLFEATWLTLYGDGYHQ